MNPVWLKNIRLVLLVGCIKWKNCTLLAEVVLVKKYEMLAITIHGLPLQKPTVAMLFINTSSAEL